MDHLQRTEPTDIRLYQTVVAESILHAAGFAARSGCGCGGACSGAAGAEFVHGPRAGSEANSGAPCGCARGGESLSDRLPDLAADADGLGRVPSRPGRSDVQVHDQQRAGARKRQSRSDHRRRERRRSDAL